MVDAGYNVRKAGLNGLTSWQPHKEKYLQFVLENGDSKIPLRQEFVDFVKKLNYQTTNKDHSDVILTLDDIVLDNKTETDHFIIQHFRIPMMENYNLSIVKLAQLAYNIGQAGAVFGYEDAYASSIEDFYSRNNLGDLMTYITALKKRM